VELLDHGGDPRNGLPRRTTRTTSEEDLGTPDVLDALASLRLTLVEDQISESAMTYQESFHQRTTRNILRSVPTYSH